MSFPDDALSCDAFLGGRLQLLQPKAGYRAGVDPILLAAAVQAQAGQSVLELGCGSGVASLALSARIGGLECTGVELQADYAALARRNAAANDLPLEVVCADLSELPADLRQRQFDHVIANPPYFDRTRSTKAADSGRERGLGEDTPLADWVQVAARRLAPKGTALFIQRAARLPDLLSAMMRHLGSLEVQPLAPRSGRPAHLVLVRGKKAGGADFRLFPPLVLHEGAQHDEKRKDYNPLVEAALREGAGLPAFGTA